MRYIILILTIIATQTSAFIAFDCGGRTSNISAISLLDIQECDIPRTRINAEKIHAQLLQIKEYEEIEVKQCKIEITREINFCGMHSHNSAVLNGLANYILEVPREECDLIHRTGTTRIVSNAIIDGIKENHIQSHSLTLAGRIDADGSCKGVEYADSFGSWSNVVVQGIVKILIQKYKARINLNENKIFLRSGISYRATDKSCLDLEGGSTYWETLPKDFCGHNEYDILFEGPIDKIFNEDKTVIYSLTTNEITFALARKGRKAVCGYEISLTEHPKLVILEAKNGEGFKKKALKTINLDIFTYVNSKFVYIEKHLRYQIKQLYFDVLSQRCALEKQVLKNSLSLATQAPDEFAYNIMKGPGYMAVAAGEVAYILKCIPVEVSIRKTNECYSHLPVKYQDKELFMTPKTRILVKKGSQINCNSIIPPMYSVNNAWYKLLPNPVEAKKPEQLKPLTKQTWTYTNPESLAINGIYSQEDIRKLKEHIMFPAEKPAVLNTVAKGMTGQTTNYQGASITNLIDETTFAKILQSAGEKIWRNYMLFGTTTAGIMGLIIIIKIIKAIIDTVVHGYALHSAYGWSIYLIGAIWDSITNLLLHLSKKNNNDNNNKHYQAVPELELQELQITPPNTTQSEVHAEPSAPKELDIRQTNKQIYPNLQNSHTEPQPEIKISPQNFTEKKAFALKK
uniref:Glycoprotein n=1 Tax=Hymenopteran chu-related virus OKIAV146 TaxID=2792591 RepID=A0A7T0Q4M6_9VIRU|nr:glycoprotein [Hymenopteran chu-related virus OKIAV146]